MKKQINKLSFYIIGFFTVLLLVVVFFAPYLVTFDPHVGNLKDAFIAPNAKHIFGTDGLGRDIFSRILYGIRTSLVLSLLLISIISIIGSLLGLVAGYYGRWIDSAIMRVSDVLISCPSMVLAIALAGIMGASVENAMFAIFIVSISKYIRLSRSLTIKVVNAEYIKSAEIIGTSNINIMKRHIIPNVIQPLFITATTDIGVIILELSALSFLGFGVPPTIPELGFMISEGRSYMLYSPWLVFYPGLAIFMIVCICNLVGDKLNDYFN